MKETHTIGEDRFATETMPPDGVEEVFHKIERGEALRSVVVF